MKYLVMECHPAYAVVLRADGEFLKVANMHYEIGQELSDVTELKLPKSDAQPQKKSGNRWLHSLAGAAACFLLVMTSLFFADHTPYASVYVTINPEVRIDVNRHDRVVDVEGVNADGQMLLEGYDYSRKDLDLVVDELVDRAIDMGFLHEGGKVTLSLDADNEWVVGHQEHLKSQLNDYLSEKISVSIDVEQQASRESEPKLPDAPIVIPVTPADSDTDYDDDDYENDDAGDDEDERDADEDDDRDDTEDDDHNEDDGMTDYGIDEDNESDRDDEDDDDEDDE